jgi:hypothetical protein
LSSRLDQQQSCRVSSALVVLKGEGCRYIMRDRAGPYLTRDMAREHQAVQVSARAVGPAVVTVQRAAAAVGLVVMAAPATAPPALKAPAQVTAPARMTVGKLKMQASSSHALLPGSLHLAGMQGKQEHEVSRG